MTTDAMVLGTSNLRVAPLGIGAWAWGDKLMWGYGKGDYTDADLRTAFDVTVAAGVNFFDTAEFYGFGRSETLLGQFIRDSGKKVVVATKFMPAPYRLGKGALRNALQHSLKRLGMAQVDLYQMHFPLPPVAIETWMEALADAVEAGLTRTVGVSNYSPVQMGRAYNALNRRNVRLTSNQVHYSLLHRAPELDGTLQVCRDLKVTLIAYSPLEMGLLTGKYTPETPPPGVRRRQYNRTYLEKIQPLIAVMRNFGEAHDGKTPAQVALNWAICKGTLPIPGAKNARQAAANAGALGWRLTETEVATLDEASLQCMNAV